LQCPCVVKVLWRMSPVTTWTVQDAHEASACNIRLLGIAFDMVKEKWSLEFNISFLY
jgi:hypothetical protein